MAPPECIEINVGDQIMTSTPFYIIRNIRDAWLLQTEIESLESNYEENEIPRPILTINIHIQRYVSKSLKKVYLHGQRREVNKRGSMFYEQASRASTQLII